MNFEKCHECVRARLLAGIVQNRRGVYVCIFLSDLIFYVPSTICRRVWIRLARDLNDRCCYRFILQM